MPITQDIDNMGQIKMHQSFLSLRLKSYTKVIFLNCISFLMPFRKKTQCFKNGIIYLHQQSPWI